MPRVLAARRIKMSAYGLSKYGGEGGGSCPLNGAIHFRKMSPPPWHKQHNIREDPKKIFRSYLKLSPYVATGQLTPHNPIIIITLMLNTGEIFVASLCRRSNVTNYYYYRHRPNPHDPHCRQDVPSFFFHFSVLFPIVSVLCSSPTELATLSPC